MTVEFWVAAIIFTATPGTGVVFTIAAGLARGTQASVVAALGCTLGIVPHMALALTGAAAVLAASPIAFEVVKWLGVAYLLYMAWGNWHQTSVLNTSPAENTSGVYQSAVRIIGSAILVNLLNPKLTLFFFVFLPLFVDASAAGAAFSMVILSLCCMAITFVIFVIYGLCAAWVRQYVINRPVVMQWIGRGFAVAFVVLAAVLALTRF